MIKTALHIQRLKLLARKLKGQFENDYSHVGYVITRRNKNCVFFHKGKPYLTHPAILFEMEILFKSHFRRNIMGEIVYGSKKTSIFFSLPFFFGLSTQEFIQIFLVRCYYPPTKFSNNIQKFLRTIKNEPMVDERIHVRRVLIEKISASHPEIIFKNLQNS
jgi:hypothetical protein